MIFFPSHLGTYHCAPFVVKYIYFQIYNLKTSADEFVSRTIFLMFKVIDMLFLPQTNTLYLNKAKYNCTPNQAKQ